MLCQPDRRCRPLFLKPLPPPSPGRRGVQVSSPPSDDALGVPLGLGGTGARGGTARTASSEGGAAKSCRAPQTERRQPAGRRRDSWQARGQRLRAPHGRQLRPEQARGRCRPTPRPEPSSAAARRPRRMTATPHDGHAARAQICTRIGAGASPRTGRARPHPRGPARCGAAAAPRRPRAAPSPPAHTGPGRTRRADDAHEKACVIPDQCGTRLPRRADGATRRRRPGASIPWAAAPHGAARPQSCTTLLSRKELLAPPRGSTVYLGTPGGH